GDSSMVVLVILKPSSTGIKPAPHYVAFIGQILSFGAGPKTECWQQVVVEVLLVSRCLFLAIAILRADRLTPSMASAIGPGSGTAKASSVRPQLRTVLWSPRAETSTMKRVHSPV